jgi:hypothetical protein
MRALATTACTCSEWESMELFMRVLLSCVIPTRPLHMSLQSVALCFPWFLPQRLQLCLARYGTHCVGRLDFCPQVTQCPKARFHLKIWDAQTPNFSRRSQCPKARFHFKVTMAETRLLKALEDSNLRRVFTPR